MASKPKAKIKLTMMKWRAEKLMEEGYELVQYRGGFFTLRKLDK